MNRSLGHLLVGADRPRVPAPAERDLRDRVAREGIQSFLELTGTLNGLPERVRRGGWRGDERAARVNDRREAPDGGDGLAPDRDGAAADDPVPDRGGDVVVLDVAGVELGVCAAEEELGAGGGELEGEGTLADDILLDRCREEGVLERRERM